ncbi:MAG: (Fe-S)-binding protein [Bacteroidetes bacterium]|nr:(Fe-S)-binding protein [Bacteroidota bacterium]
MIPNIIFILLLFAAILFFYKNVKTISGNINRGKKLDLSDQKQKRWRLMFLVTILQSKMLSRPIVGILHIFVYFGFIIVNIEMLEILIDGIWGSHRVFAFIGNLYPILITVFELFALSVILVCIVFLIRRNILKVKRFWNKEMTLWPRSDANIILITEVFLMSSIFMMNACDSILQERLIDHYVNVGDFPLSGLFIPLFEGLPTNTLIFLERFGWWFHIIGVLMFLNYIPYSKHFHVFLAFPNVYYTRLEPKGKMADMPSVTKEIKLMLDGSFEPQEEENAGKVVFGAKNIEDLTWKNLMDAYSCTECGRCTSRCPANITGKLLSPRKIMMDVRDMLESVRKTKNDTIDKKTLFDFIQPEELWACTTCNACAIECPVNIEPLSIILEMRRYLALENAAAPAELNAIFTNIENNGAPWQFSPQDRMKWAEDIYVNKV